MRKKTIAVYVILVLFLFIYFLLPKIKEKIFINEAKTNLIQLKEDYNYIVENYMNDEINFDDYKKDKQKEYLAIKDNVIGNSEYTIYDLINSINLAYFKDDSEQFINILNTLPKSDTNLLLEKISDQLQIAILVLYSDLNYDIYNDELESSSFEIDPVLQDLIYLNEAIYSINKINNKSKVINYTGTGNIKYDGIKSAGTSIEYSSLYTYFGYIDYDRWEDIQSEISDNDYYYLFMTMTTVPTGNHHYEFDFMSIIIIYEYEKIIEDQEKREDFKHYIIYLFYELELSYPY